MLRAVLRCMVVLLAVAARVEAVQYAYVLDSQTHLLKLNLKDLSVAALWFLDEVKDLGSRFPPRSVEWTYVADLAFGRDAGDVYLEFPGETGVAEDQPILFKVVRIRLPRWDAVQAEYDLPVRLVGGPHLALNPESRELYVEYTKPTSKESASVFLGEVHVLDGFSLRELRTYQAQAPRDPRQLGPGQTYPFFGEGTRFLPATDLAYQGGRLIRFSGSTFTAERISFYDLLSPEAKAQLAQRFTLDPQSQQPRVALTPIESVGRWALAWARGIARGALKTDLYVVLDLVARTASSLLETPFGEANLLSDGSVLVRDLKPPLQGNLGDRDTWSATGTVSVYDPAEGKKVKSFDEKLLAGESRSISFLCSAPEADVVFFTVAEGDARRLAVLRLSTGTMEVVKADFWPDRNTRCFFADEGR